MAKLHVGFHQSNFWCQAEGWAKTTDANINIANQHHWFPRYIGTFEVDADGKRWKLYESLLKNLHKDIIMVFEQWTKQKLRFTFWRQSGSSQLCLEIVWWKPERSLALRTWRWDSAKLWKSQQVWLNSIHRKFFRLHTGGTDITLQVFETFGPVQRPFYSVRFNKESDIKEKNVLVGDKVLYAPDIMEYSHYVFVSQLKK